MNKEISLVIEKYVESIQSDKYHRYGSWDICHEAFYTIANDANHALHLAFYLASWGMYRGSSGLLQKNHIIHEKAVDILLQQKYKSIRCHSENEVTKDNIGDILSLKEELSNYYSNINFIRGSNEEKGISTTDTLLSKIILGTLGCVPAYDRYFIKGLKINDIKLYEFNKPSLQRLFIFIEEKNDEIESAKRLIKEKTGSNYPFMKILDMYFWQIGYENALIEDKGKKKSKIQE